ncbi:MAG: GNAT family N-acetyltransferase [Oscillospiraceae bacterium]|jgi:RimJ/RimL family protein N-acetyltransferase|nr:GNAT family N-acetyltransferase [Oscillospiraceae bacterium]
MKYFSKITGGRIYLSPIDADDAELYARWLNDPAVAVNLGLYGGLISLPNEKRVLERMTDEGHNYAIVLKDGDELLGNISLMNIDQIHRRATLGLFIGEAARRGKGYGAEAIRLLLGFGFNTLNLHNIMLMCHAGNAQGIACYEKAGFREFGRRREAHFRGGGYTDVVYMEILDSEFAGG